MYLNSLSTALGLIRDCRRVFGPRRVRRAARRPLSGVVRALACGTACALTLLAQGVVSATQLSTLVAQSLQDPVVELAPGRFGGALHREPECTQAAGGVVILHRAGAEPNDVGVIRALRVGLPREGWHTVSVQLEPVLGPLGQWHQGVFRRLSAAVKYFTGKAALNVVILA
jgi:hypothetical protein